MFLLRQCKEPRGIVAAGIAASEPYERDDWGGPGVQWCVDIDFDVFLDADTEEILPTEALKQRVPIPAKWAQRSSGQRIPADAAELLEKVWQKFLQNNRRILTSHRR